jgi:thiol-disulfide isomerase/thioredoxin
MKKILPFLAMTAGAAVLGVLVKDSLRPTPAAAPARPKPASADYGSSEGARRRLVDLGVPPGPGKVRVLHFWATWCPPCVEELPGLLAWAKENRKDSRLELITVSVDDDWKVVDPWLAKHGGTELPVWLDAGKSVATAFGTSKFPETYVIGADGRVLRVVRGPMDWSSPRVRTELASLVAGSAPSPRS